MEEKLYIRIFSQEGYVPFGKENKLLQEIVVDLSFEEALSIMQDSFNTYRRDNPFNPIEMEHSGLLRSWLMTFAEEQGPAAFLLDA
jgi:hypothetical protein